VNAIDPQRKALARRATGALAAAKVRQMLATSVDEVAPGMQLPIIVVLPEDPMGYVFDRLREHHRGAVLASLDATEHLVFVPMAPASLLAKTPVIDRHGPCPINRQTTMSMLLALLKVTDGPIACREVAPTVCFERVVDPGELIAH
jgi:hypothetical protein